MEGRFDLVGIRDSSFRIREGNVPLKTLSSILWWLSVVTWFTAIVASGAAAISAFTQLPPLEATMPGIEAYYGDDSAGAAKFVAGYVTNPIFLVGDIVCLSAALGCVLALATSRLQPCGSGRAGILAVICVMIAGGALGTYLLLVAPPLADALAEWRTAVLADDREAASAAWALFDPLHHTASRLMNAQMALLLIAVVSGAAAITRIPDRKSADS